MNKTINKNKFKTLAKRLAKNGIEGWYFTKNNNNNYTNKEKKLIKEVLLSKGFKCKGVNDYEIEFDNDRSYRPTISFILNK